MKSEMIAYYGLALSVTGLSFLIFIVGLRARHQEGMYYERNNRDLFYWERLNLVFGMWPAMLWILWHEIWLPTLPIVLGVIQIIYWIVLLFQVLTDEGDSPEISGW